MTLVRVPNQPLSLWQSVVAEVMREKLVATGADANGIAVLDHPAVLATNDFVQARCSRTSRLLAPDPAAADPHTLNVYLSGLCFDIARARVEHRHEDEARLLADYWPISNSDPGFLTCVTTYEYYSTMYGGVVRYNDWRTATSPPDINYGVIGWTLPSSGKVAILGDWGTNLYLDDSTALLVDVLEKHQPDAIIHLGDIYYSGTPLECTAFVQAIEVAFERAQFGPVPVFTLPGNHDYYALGYGFYPMLGSLNTGIDDAAQVASYFCLRTDDGRWQFLGMDTGWADSDPLNQENTFYAGPWLQPDEIAWHKDKLDHFSGATILLSHHQLFSANSKINGGGSSESEFPYLNPMLLNVFEPYFRTKIAAWMWGHEHSIGIFQNGLFGLATGRLVGASAYEEAVSDEPYKVNYPEVPYLEPTTWQAPANAPPNDAYLEHSYAVIDLSTDPVNVSYYAFPSWDKSPPQSPTSTQLFTETFRLPTPTPQQEVDFGADVVFVVEGGLTYVGPLYWDGLPSGEYFPTIVGSGPVTLQLVGSTQGPILHGSSLLIKTTESAAGDYNYLGSWSIHTLYYYLPGYANQVWTICKLDPTDPVVHFGDAVYFLSKYDPGNWITPTDNPYIGSNNQYLTTTDAGVPTLFTLALP